MDFQWDHALDWNPSGLLMNLSIGLREASYGLYYSGSNRDTLRRRLLCPIHVNGLSRFLSHIPMDGTKSRLRGMAGSKKCAAKHKYPVGDDVLITNSKVASKYTKFLSKLDNGTIEFAKKFWVKKMQIGRGLPLNPYLKNKIIACLRKEFKPKELRLPPEQLLFEGELEFNERTVIYRWVKQWLKWTYKHPWEELIYSSVGLLRPLKVSSTAKENMSFWQRRRIRLNFGLDFATKIMRHSPAYLAY
ncbi:hypothetical protein Ahy_B01g055316 [Arachis hypogaea]|uniref:Uncharacterized protein n=1 Tax=Arachis hypogaea TaxID=3818 RepID=A0A445AVW6_ARAHY|nr:hypothetical protein Ahy_B01g055316 [Arachis hypogaea]